MNEIYQGDSGTVLSITITNDDSIVDLTDSTVDVVIKYKRTGIKKVAAITDAINGKCEITLNAEDVVNDGIYSLQATVNFSNGNKFSSNVQRFIVNKKIGYVPVIGGSTGNVGDSTINGNLIVNGIEIKVYDDTLVRGDINNLKQSQHTHANKAALDRLDINEQNHLTIDGVELVTGGSGGSSVSDSTINGNILINGQNVKIYDDTTLQTEITTIKNSDVIKRIGISMNGKLTIDGVEVTLDDPTSPIDGGTFTTAYNTTIVDGGEF